MMRLAGKVALITGGAAGIGQQTAVRFAAEGARVVVADRDGDGAKACAAHIIETGGDAISIKVDVTSRFEVDRAVSETVGHFGGIDVVVNNAGVDVYGAVHEMSEDRWDQQIDTNLKSVYLVSHAAWPHLKAGGGGLILNTGSIAGLRGIGGNAAYCVSKAGVIMLTKCLAESGATDRIRANCVSPGFIATSMVDQYFADQEDPQAARDETLSLVPVDAFGQPRNIADAFVFLASDEAAYITGSNLVVDGGVTSKM